MIPLFPTMPFSSRHWNDNAKTLRYSRAEDTFDYKNNLCYEYDELLFDGLTPEEYLRGHIKRPVGTTLNSALPEEGQCDEVCQEIDGKKHCEEICKTENGNLARVSVGVVIKKKSPSGLNIFELCQDEKCVEAGSLGTFGESSNALLVKREMDKKGAKNWQK